MVRSLAAKLGGEGTRIFELVIGPIRTRPCAANRRRQCRLVQAHAGSLIGGISRFTDTPLQCLFTRGGGMKTTPLRQAGPG